MKHTFANRELLVAGLIFLLLLGGSVQGLAESLFDSPSRFDPIDEPVFDDARDAGVETEQESESLLEALLLKDSRYTLGYELSLGTEPDPEIITHYAYFRQETRHLLSDNLFFKLDGRLMVLPKGDHRADAKAKNLLLTPRLRELYVQAGFDKFSIKLGQQIVVWGKADAAIITDVVSPRDTSEFIFIELEDARFGQPMLATDIYTDHGNLFVFISPHPLTDRAPADDTRYDRQLPGTDLFAVKTDDLTCSDVEYGVRWEAFFEKTDVSLMAGRFFANTAVYDVAPSYDSEGKPILIESCPSYAMMGMAATHAKGSFLFTAESAFKHELALQGLDALQGYVAVKKNIFDVSLGVHYNANDRYQVSVEVSHRYVPGSMKHLAVTDKNSTAGYFTLTKDFLHQTLAAEYMVYYHIQNQNAVHQFRLTRDVTDNFQIIAAGGFFNIRDEESVLWAYKDEDRLTMEIKYFF
jgi:hypothetical protein